MQSLRRNKLGEKSGLTQRKISFWESGKIEPDMDLLIQVSKFFGVSTDYLLGLED
jgi:transcriptional regulator with XRE-family HTH domain